MNMKLLAVAIPPYILSQSISVLYGYVLNLVLRGPREREDGMMVEIVSTLTLG